IFMRKVIAGLFVAVTALSAPFVGFSEASAASASNAVLQASQTSSSTSRITVNSSMKIVVQNWGTKDIGYTIFKRGSVYATGNLKGGKSYNNTISLPKDDYSVRLYCGGPSGGSTGCSGQVSIANK
ncbi:hypothetical protein ACQ3VH_28955, partial [Bacillus pretiosus]